MTVPKKILRIGGRQLLSNDAEYLTVDSLINLVQRETLTF